MIKKHLIEFIVERTAPGYSAYATHYDVYTVGATLAELKANMVEALNLHLADKCRTVAEGDMKVTLDLAQYISGHKKLSTKQVTRILDGVRAVGRELADIDLSAAA